MIPLLATAAASAASSLIERFAQPKQPAPAGNVPFSEALDKAQGQRPAVQLSPEALRQQKMAQLRQRLLGSPELQTELGSADPAKQPSISVGADGSVTATTPDGRTHALQLSPETAALAKELGSMELAGGANLPGAGAKVAGATPVVSSSSAVRTQLA